MTRDDARRPDELITAGEIAAMCNVSPSAVSNWQRRSDTGKLQPPFPEPWLTVRGWNPRKRIPLFVRSEVETWAAERAATAIERNARNIVRLESQLAAARAKSDAIASGSRTESVLQ